MSEHLVIRLPSQADQVVHWLIWSTAEKEIIASGELNHVSELAQLTESASERTVKVLVPGGDLHLRRVDVDNKMKRQLAQALPYMLEEELASDVEQLHFARLHDESGAVYVAIVAQKKMDLWLDWLEQADLQCRQMLPDMLALPYIEQSWSAVQLADAWLVRTGEATGVSVESEWLELMLQPLQSDPLLPVHCYSELPASAGEEWLNEPVELPMQLLAQGAISSSANMLQGEYQPQKEYSAALLKWKNVAILAVVVLLAAMINKGLTIAQLSAEQQRVRAEIHQVHRVLFPDVKKIRDTSIRRRVKERLKLAQAGSGQGTFLTMMSDLVESFNSTPELEPESLKFDLKRHEIRLAASANSFQTFEQFKSQAGELYQVEQGSLTNKNGNVSGTLVIKGR